MHPGGGAIMAGLLAIFAAPAVAFAAPNSYGQAFVSAFAEACIPDRQSYPGTLATAERVGWMPVAETSHAELSRLMDLARAGATDPNYPDWRFEYRAFGRPVGERPHFLVVTRLVAPTIANYVGCYLYDFDAEAPIDPALVTGLLDQPIAYSLDQDGLVSHVWGPAPGLPGTGDTYMTFVGAGSPHAATTGFTGLVIKFDTYEPGSG